MTPVRHKFPPATPLLAKHVSLANHQAASCKAFDGLGSRSLLQGLGELAQIFFLLLTLV